MKVADLIHAKWGVTTGINVNPLVGEIGTTAVRVLPNNPNRLGYLLINMSANTLYLGFTNDVSSSKGIYISANGGNYGMLWEEDYEIACYELYGIASGVNSSIYVFEIVIVGDGK